MANEWHEIVQDGRHQFLRDFDGTRLTIEKTEVPGAWFCELPNGKRAIGSLRIVKWVAESAMFVRCDDDFRILDAG